MRRISLPLLIAVALSLPAMAATIYNEAVLGAYSGSGLSPTQLTFAPGSNQIAVPFNFLLSSITLMDTAIGAKGFLGLESGNQLTLPSNTATAAGLLGWWHYTPSDKNKDLLLLMAVPANGSSGFTPPLAAGAYTLSIQDTSAGTFTYGLDVSLQEVPEPMSGGAVLRVSLFCSFFDGCGRRF